MRAARCRQAMESGARAPRMYPRYPRYPQAVCPFNGNNFMTAISPWPRRSSGNGGEPSQPQPQPSGFASHQAESSGAKGGAADEAAARRTMAGLPFSGCESGRLRKAPKRFPGGLRARGRPAGRTPGLRVQDLSGGKRDFGSRAATGGTWGFGLWILRAGPGFGPGAAKPADPGLRSMDRQAEPRLRPRNRQSGKRDASPKSAERRTARASALSGSPRGNLKELRLLMDPGGSGASSPRFAAPPTRNRPARDASPPRLGSSNGTVGAGGNVGPH